MSNDPTDNLKAQIDAIDFGNIDAISPEQIAELETALNAHEAGVSHLADRLAKPDPRLASALDAAERPAMPPPEAWDRMWDRITAETGRHQHAPAAPHRIVRLWRPAAAVAACLFLATAWWLQTPTTASDPWPVTLATNVEIEQVESFGDTMPLVMSVGDEGMPVIWVVEDTGA